MALALETGQSTWTVAVFAALGLRFGLTVEVGIAYQSRRATAKGQVILDFAFGARRAWVAVEAWIDTLSVDTLSVAGAVAVGLTADDETSIERISSVTA